MWLFATASVVNITDISFCYRFESILWWFGIAKASKWWKIDPTGSPCADCNKALLKNKVNFLEVAQGRVGQEVIMGSNKKNYIPFTPLFYFWYWKRTVWWLKKYIGLFTFVYLKNAGRSECMGHNTCKSMGRVLCVVRRWDHIDITLTSHWHHIDTTLTLNWHHSDIILTSYWHHSDITLRSYWHHIDIILTSHWHYIDITLTSHWDHIDVIILIHIDVILKSYWRLIDITLRCKLRLKFTINLIHFIYSIWLS